MLSLYFSDWESWYEIKELSPKWYIDDEEEISQNIVMENLISHEVECSGFRKTWKYKCEFEKQHGNQERHFRQVASLKESYAMKRDNDYNNSERSVILKSVLLMQQIVPTVQPVQKFDIYDQICAPLGPNSVPVEHKKQSANKESLIGNEYEKFNQSSYLSKARRITPGKKHYESNDFSNLLSFHSLLTQR